MRECVYRHDPCRGKTGSVPDCCKAAMKTEHGGICACGEHEVHVTRMRGKVIAADIWTVCHHEWEITDYTDDNTVMRGPVCSKCGAIGEYILPGGWQEALAMTVSHDREKLEETEHRIMDSDVPPEAKKEALKWLQSADDHLTAAQKTARDSLGK